VDCPENLIISHDSKWTSEALFNLLDNAVKYTPSGGKISVSVVQWEMYVEVKVTDTGKGISESNQAAIFRRFYREEEVHDQQSVLFGLVVLAREVDAEQLRCFPKGKPLALTPRKVLENTVSRSPVQEFPQIFFSTNPPAW
jgi:K+-sensing histidine kinase KdpD